MIDKQKLVKIVGAGNVCTEPADLEPYSRDISFVNQLRPACVVKPGKAADVQKIIKLANETQTPLVPVSSGAPHFRGDTVPTAGGSVVVDMSRMNKVVFVDQPRRVAMVEAGTTFGELLAAATKEGLRINMPLLPRKTKTVVGSLLEREPVIMPKYQWDVSDPLSCLGLYFGNGEEFRTGQAAGPGTVEEQWKVGGLQKAPYGPGIGSWHRLVQGSQGTIGIVTWASMRCELMPNVEEPFFVGSDDLEALLEYTSWLVRLRMPNECFILNRTNLAAIFAKKWTKDYESLKDALPEWILFYNLPGFQYYPEERVATYVQDASKITQRLGLDARKAAGGISAYEMLETVQQPCADPYWKLRYKGAFEDILYLSLQEKIANQVKLMYAAADEAGYPASDVGVYLQPIVQGVGYHCEFTLFYDPDNCVDADKVKGLSESATRTLMANGGFFSRPYGPNTWAIFNHDSASVSVLNKIKSIVDPNGIMNPGKICF
jgi:FAD/FMN-containing dehydrogenase